MNQKAEALEIIKIWIQKAENDLKNANHTMLMGDNCPFDTVCFHAQQSVEKYLKALLISKDTSFPKSHDLTELLSLLPDKIKKHFSLVELAELTPYSIETRYPTLGEPITKEDAIKALEITEKVKSLICKYLPPESL